MTGGVRSQKQDREELVQSLRSSGSSWVDVAEALKTCYRINPRLAFRYAHGWSQDKAAEEWNKRWPDEQKSFKNFSNWESWPGSTGHAPSYNNLGKLAELYECAVSDLLADLPNFRHLDTAGEKPIVAKKKLILTAGRTLEPGPAGSTQEDADAWEALSPLLLTQEHTAQVRQLGQLSVAELAQAVVMWLQRLDPSVNRRELLHRLGVLFAAAATGPVLDVLDVLDPDEQQHVLHVIQDQEVSGFDEPTLRYCEGMVNTLAQQDNVLGPQFTLQSTIGHRQLAERLAKAAPEAFKLRAISAYTDITSLLGWLCFKLGNYQSAQYYYEEARSAAHDAKNSELATYILCAMSQLATSQGKARIGIDHAAAAAVWAEESRSPLAQGYAAEVAVVAYAADHQPDSFRRKLDEEYAFLHSMRPDESRNPLWYFYDESSYWRTVGVCELTLQQPEAALKALDKSLALVDPAHRHNKAIRQLHRAEAYVQQEEITEATSIIGNVAAATAVGRSQPITERIASVRGLLIPWQHTKPVRELDERLMVYRVGRARGTGSGG